MPPSPQLESRLGQIVHRALLGGVLASAALLILGLLLLAGSESPQRPPVTDWLQLLSLAAAGDGRAVIDLGLIVLMFTPVVRVLVLATGWLFGRQWLLAAVSLTVAALLAASVALGVG